MRDERTAGHNQLAGMTISWDELHGLIDLWDELNLKELDAVLHRLLARSRLRPTASHSCLAGSAGRSGR